ncbi:hypothetical protein QIL46_gp1 [ssRNA phage Esthiorhiza.2_38]|uniref:Uncharacterized protein n=2 Tax=Fiersviridae TaxID=2842319 RepID=A0A8S5KZ01_9VIRU|nr:hypothetical protein QIL46_gp1 [ssRNA phage Esthiorhiza.2_38]QDH87732.1 MAG: hypothetical protein H2RhizoLitter49740_000001 [Leviviridae sp.]DAD50391.1 TPA_asm: hypothetical protein [ssRNA phage Esthiorhiza.2_38]
MPHRQLLREEIIRLWHHARLMYGLDGNIFPGTLAKSKYWSTKYLLAKTIAMRALVDSLMKKPGD